LTASGSISAALASAGSVYIVHRAKIKRSQMISRNPKLGLPFSNEGTLLPRRHIAALPAMRSIGSVSIESCILSK
jgi:hypothetical protein